LTTGHEADDAEDESDENERCADPEHNLEREDPGLAVACEERRADGDE
jgi:hypothetical protein